MSNTFTGPRVAQILESLIGSDKHENETVEFKSNYLEPQKLGEYISALANAAAINGSKFAYLVFGVEDGSKKIIGTKFDAEMKAVGNQSLQPWLHSRMSVGAHFEFNEAEVDGFRIVLLTIHASQNSPVLFNKTAFCRVGSHKKLLSDHPELERLLWKTFDETPYELRVASDVLSSEEILEALSFVTWYDLQNAPVPVNDEEILNELANAGMVVRAEVSGWHVTNMGALLLARKLNNFPSMVRKAVRLFRYKGDSKAAEAIEITGTKGYATGFLGLVKKAKELVPAFEVFEGGIRKNVPQINERVLRELIANSLVHQDLSATGAGPTIEIYDDRVEIGNPGESLIPADRIIGSLPKSRNEKFALASRRMGLCEERGSGWDLVGNVIDAEGFPAPLIESKDGAMRVTVWWKRPIADYAREELIQAVYFHALVQDAKRKRVTNATVKHRFGLPEKDGGKASKLLRAAVDEGLLKIYDPEAGLKSRSYVPYFAVGK